MINITIRMRLAASVMNRYTIMRIAFLALFLVPFFSIIGQAQTISTVNSGLKTSGRVLGLSGGPALKVFPDTINFGRVRLGEKRDSAFSIVNKDSVVVSLIDLEYSLDTINHPNFIIRDLGAKGAQYPLATNEVVTDSVGFFPIKTGADTVRIPIFSTDPDSIYALQEAPTVVLLGTGIAPSVASNGHDFGPVRVDSASMWQTITIVNPGSDSTAVDNVTIVDSSSIADFIISFDTLPPIGGSSPLMLDYEGNAEHGDTVLSFAVQFCPLSLGADTIIVRIHTVDSAVLFDTLTGVGVEPLVIVKQTTQTTMDFDTIRIPPGTLLPSPITMQFQLTNAGTMVAKLDSLRSTDDSDFNVSLNPPNNLVGESLGVNDSAVGIVTFIPTDVGNFADTIYFLSDTRYNLYPVSYDTVHKIILNAEVRTGPIGGDSISFDTITTCDTVTNDVYLQNPYPVEIHIDSIKLVSDTGGFSIPNTFIHAINIAANDSAPVHLSYSFPQDSLNGQQQLKLVAFQRSGLGEPPILDTVTANLERQQRVFALKAVLPTFVASADDIAPLRLPITVTGPRAGVTELDSWTLSLQFSNDLFVPVGVDTAGSLAVPGDATSSTGDGGYSITKRWDQSSRTYYIIVTGCAVADSANIRNDLLLTLELRAYLTTDTVVTVTPTFTWFERPCAYNLQAFTLKVPYANDCGDQTIRDAMLGESKSIYITSVWPNPALASGDVSVGYDAKVGSAISCIVSDELGEETGRINRSVPIGRGSLTIPTAMLPKSGPAFVRIEAMQPSSDGGSFIPVQSFKIEVIK